ncbi:MAG: protein kinase [Pirellulales bacterium]
MPAHEARQANSQDSCPTLDDLLRLIDGVVDPSSQISQHVSVCKACQERLNEHTSSKLVQPAWYKPTSVDRESAARVLSSLYRRLELVESKSDLDSNQPVQLQPAMIPGSIGELKQYLIVRELASGGSATVFEGVDRNSGQRVAIKFIRSRDPMVLKRAEREVRAVQKLNHPNVIPIHTIEMSEDHRLFLVMPLFEGKTLADWIDSQGPMPSDTAVQVVKQIAVALMAAHDAGIWHRDVKPSNIMIDDQFTAWLTDFGLASVYGDDTTLTESGTLMGTPAYMSPEQAKAGKQIDHRSDVYSLGATFYECITGTRPFRGIPQKIIRDVLLVDPPRPRLLVEQIPIDIETICLKAMQKDAPDRYQTIQQFHDDLVRWQKGQRIQAKRVGSLQSLWQWSKREPRLSGTIAVSLAAIFVALIVSVFNWQRAEQRSRLAESRFDQARQAIDRLADVSESLVGNDPAIESVRQSLLGSVEQFLGDLVRERPTDPDNLEKYYLTIHRLARIRGIVSGPDSSIQLRETALAESSNDLTRYSKHEGIRQAHCLLGIGLASMLYEKGRQQESLDLLDAIAPKLDQSNLGDHAILAALHQMKGSVYAARYTFQEAKNELDMALSFGKSAQATEKVSIGTVVARANHTLGLCEMLLGNPQAAEKPLSECIDYFDAACQKTPNNENAFNAWFSTLINLERSYIQRRQSEKALEINQQISSKTKSHLAKYPSHRIPQFVWLSLRTDAEICRIQLGKYSEAMEELGKIQAEIAQLAIDFPQDLYVTRSQLLAGSTAAIAALHLGQLTDAASLVDRFESSIRTIDHTKKNQVFQLEDAVMWYVLRALIHEHAGEYDQSLACWSRAVELQPSRFSQAIKLLQSQTQYRSENGQFNDRSSISADNRRRGLEELQQMIIVTAVASDWADGLLASSYQFVALEAEAGLQKSDTESVTATQELRYQAAGKLESMRARGFFEPAVHAKRLQSDPILRTISPAGAAKVEQEIN